MNIIERNLSLIEHALGANFSLKKINDKDSFLYSKTKTLIIGLSESKKNILIIPGASHNSKRYSCSKLAELTKLMDENFYVIWGDQNEKILAEDIKSISPKVNICSKLKLDQLILLISKVDLVIGPDTGPTHISWALNIPSIMLFGPTPGYRNTFATKIHRVIESESTVNPNNIDRSDNSINNIDVLEVLKESRELLRITKNIYK